MFKLKIIVTSTRPGRIGVAVSHWFESVAKESADFEVEVVDLKDIDLPFFDEPKHPMLKDYEKDHTKRWSKLIEDADAFTFIMPEYNYFAPATLVNAIDFLSHEWNYKPAGIVSYGGVSAGTRSAQSIKPLLTSVKMMPIPEGVFIPFVHTFVDEEGKLTLPDESAAGAKKMLGELSKWTQALKPLHT